MSSRSPRSPTAPPDMHIPRMALNALYQEIFSDFVHENLEALDEAATVLKSSGVGTVTGSEDLDYTARVNCHNTGDSMHKSVACSPVFVSLWERARCGCNFEERNQRPN